MLLLAGRDDATVDPGNTMRLAARLRPRRTGARTALPGIGHKTLIGAFAGPLTFLAPVRATRCASSRLTARCAGRTALRGWRCVIAVLILGVTAMRVAADRWRGWLVQRRTGNAGWVDVVWSLRRRGRRRLCAGARAGMAGPTPRQWLVALLAALWSLRLGLHIAATDARRPEDARYAQFRRDWGAAFQRRMFWFLQIQAAAAALLAVSMLLAARNPGRCAVQASPALLLL